MPMFARLSSLWRNLAHRERVDRDLDDELASVYQLLVDEKIQQGLKPEHARRQARLELGGVDPVKQRVREERSGALFETLVKDARYAFRMVRANPGFAFIVVVSLAAGIGANSAIFSVANAVMWRSLPVSSPEQLHIVRVQSRLPMTPRFSYPFFEQLRQGFPDPHGLAAMSRVARVRARIADGGEQEAAGVQLVSGDYFSVLALQPLLGRLLTPDDNRTVGGHPIAVVSHAFWQRRLAAAADVVGRNVTLNGARFTVVGVAPEGFTGVWLETPVDAWIPAAMQADIYYAQNVSADNARLEQPWMPQDNIRWLEIVLRADRPDGPEAVALNAVFRPVLLQAAGAIADVEQRNLLLDRRLILEPFAHGSSILRDRFRAPLFALLAMTALLLLIACANTANLLLARAAARQREMAIRLSIGASRSRVIGQLLTESVIFGAMAAAVGLGVAPLASELLVRMTIAADSGPLPFSVGIDGRLLAFTALVSVLTSLLFGLAPAWRATDLTLGEALKATARGVHRGGRASLTRSLVVVQVALSLLLVVGAGLFLQSLQNLATLPLGFEREHLVSAWIRPGTGGYERADLPGLYRRLIDAAEGLPGVQSAAVSMCGLMTGCRVNVDGLVISGYESQPGERVMVQENRVGPRYFATVGMQLVEGRDFEARDVRNPATVAIVNEATVRKYFQNRSAIGQRIGEDRAEIEIIGVVRDARVNSVREAVVPMAYYPLEPDEFANTLDVRTVGDPGRIADALRKVVAAVDPNLPLDRVTMIAEQAGSTLRQERLIARLTTVLCVLALGMACLGLYGVMSYGVKQRTPELGIRFALGASRPLVLWTVLRESLALVAIGVGMGLPLVLAASQIVGTMLFEVSPSNPTTIAASILLLLALGAISGYLPAWRASRVDPLTALRHE